MQKVEMWCGDCMELMNNIPDHGVDMILCDLPYNMTSCEWDVMLPLDELWKQYRRVIRAGGSVVLFGTEPFSSKLRMSNLDWYRYDWIWVKEQSSGGLTAKTAPLKVHETISVFYQTKSSDTTGCFVEVTEYLRGERRKTGLTNKQIEQLLGNQMHARYFTNKTQFIFPKESDYRKLQTTGFFPKPYEELAELYYDEKNGIRNTYNPIMGTGTKIKAHVAPDAKVHGANYHVVKENNGTRYPTSILRFNRESGLHPTQKPVPLLEYLIKTYTNEGESVLDNCMGSGSTGVAAYNTGRRFIGIEKDNKYFEIAKKRIEEATAQMSLF